MLIFRQRCEKYSSELDTFLLAYSYICMSESGYMPISAEVVRNIFN